MHCGQVDLPCKGGKTALMMACALGRESVVAETWSISVGLEGQASGQRRSEMKWCWS